MPPWRRVGANARATYSHAADLSPNGCVLYPLEGVGSAVLATLRAAPVMLSVRLLEDPVEIAGAFRRFERWGGVRGACQVLTLAANLWLLVALTEKRSGELDWEAASLGAAPR